MRAVDKFLLQAARSACPDGIAAAIAVGANANAVSGYDMAALHISLSLCDRQSVLQLLKGGADPNLAISMTLMRPIHFAGCYADRTCVSLLVKFGADINGTDSLGNVALHYAAEASNTEAFEHLLRLGADPHARNRNDESVIDVTRSFHIIMAFGEQGARHASLW